jgi:hypothetical protein
MFENQAEYNNFLAWKYEGSCITQRMFESVPGGKFVIPDYWQEYKILERDWPKVLPKEFSREENQWLKPS